MSTSMNNDTLANRFFDLPHTKTERLAMQVFVEKWLKISFIELRGLIETTAELLNEIGVKPGDRVILLSENSAATMVAFLAINRLQATAVLLDPELPELQQLIDFVDGRALLFSSTYQKHVQKLHLPNLAVRHIDAPFAAYPPFNSTVPAHLPPSLDADCEVAAILFTSGTTGHSKGVMVTHQNIFESIANSRKASSLTPDDRMLSLLPIHHISPLMQNLLCLFTGTSLTFISKIEGAVILNTMQTMQPTIMGAVPLVLELFNKKIQDEIEKKTPKQQKVIHVLAKISNLTRRYTSFNAGFYLFKKIQQAFGGKLTRIMCGGAAANPDTLAALSDYGFTILEAYGLSETTGAVCCNKLGQIQFGSVGFPFANNQFRVTDPDSSGKGEICISGSQIMKGYFRDPDSTAQAIKEGWFNTGDLGVIDQKGRVTITGRLKEIIVLPSGKKAVPVAVEAQYQNIEGVAELAVFGMPNSQKNAESIHAAVVLNEQFMNLVKNSQQAFQEVKTKIENLVYERAKQLAPFLQIQRIHLLESLPKTAMLKVKRTLLPAIIKELSNVAGIEEPINVAPLNHKTAEIDQWIKQWIAKKMAISATEIESQKSFIYFGLDSLSVTQLCQELQEWLSVEVSPTLIWEHSSIAKLSQHLAEQLNPVVTQAKNDKLQTLAPIPVAEDPIVIIGMACRFPGEINSPEDYWELLSQGKNAIVEVPIERWSNADYYDSHAETPGKINTRWGGFMNDIDKFDPMFFEISPLEAENMDPQQRQLLEISWEALERSGIDATSLAGTDTGVYVGISTNDYSALQIQPDNLNNINAYYGVGNALSAAAGRIAYFLGLQGVAKVIDTACSSSLVAVHDACQDLRAGNTSMAIVGGVNALLSPLTSVSLSKAKMLSPDGACKVFDADANGYVRSEGCGVVILKRLSDAKKNGDPILAFVAASAVNQDGHSNGLTAPNGEAQVALFNQVLAKANLAPAKISYIETHGTGTPLGDPIEVRSINQVYAKAHSSENPLYVGSVKSSIGHLEPAAGIAGLIKTVLMLQAQQIPAQLHFKTLNPLLKLDGIQIPTSLTAWSCAQLPRFAAVNAFGFTGTNVQIIIGEIPPMITACSNEKPYQLITLSAKTDAALKQKRLALAAWLEAHSNESLAAIAYTLNIGRAQFKKRAAWVVNSAAMLKDALQQETSSTIKSSADDVNTVMAELLNASALTSQQYQQALNKLAAIYLSGVSIPWNLFYANEINQKLLLPTYPFSKERYWLAPQKKTAAIATQTTNSLLGSEIITPLNERCFVSQIDLRQPTYRYLLDHQIYGQIIYPAAGFVELMLQAGKMLTTDTFDLLDVAIEIPLPLHEAEVTKLYITISADHRINIYTQLKNAWQCHARAQLKITKQQTPATVAMHDNTLASEINIADFYAKAKQVGFDYHEQFQTVKKLWVSPQKIVAEITTNNPTNDYACHPALLDGCFQALFANQLQTLTNDTIYLPVAISTLHFYKPMTNTLIVHGEQLSFAENSLRGKLIIMNAAHELLAELELIAMKASKTVFLKSLSRIEKNDWLYEVQWEKQVLPTTTSIQSNNTWLLITDDENNALNIALTKQLTMHGEKFKNCHINDLSSLTTIPAETNVIYLSENQASFLFLQQLISRVQPSPKLWLVTTSAMSPRGDVPEKFQQSTLWAMVKSIQHENAKLSQICIDLDANLSSARNAELLMHELRHENDEDQVALRSDGRYVPRLLLSAKSSLLALPKESDYQLVASDSRLIEDLHFKILTPRALASDEIEMKVNATALNFRDTLTVLGLYPGNPPIGVDCAGIVTRVGTAVTNFQPGDAVFGMVSGSFATRAITKAINVSHKPKALSFSEAATLPIVFLTAHYAFNHVMQLKPGQRVLIHTASGGLGLAAIQFAKLAGAEIFATAGSDEKRSYLRSLGIQHVFDSRSLQFAKDIMAATNQQGVDVVLNTLTGKDYIATTLSICSKGAYFLEVSKRDIWTDAEMASVRPDIHYTVVALDYVARDQPEFIQQLYQEISPLFENKKLTPIPFRTYSLSNAINAFQDMRQAKHIGKLVVIPEHAPKPLQATGLHVITGGLGALGLAVTNWLLAQGARHILLVNRSAPNEAAQKTLAALRNQYPDASLIPFAADIAEQKDAEKLFAYIKNQSQPLIGIMHAAGILDDGLLSNQTPEKYQRVLAPKMSGAWHLHQLSQSYDLDYFVMFSSIAALLGSPAQSNYAAANAYLDGLAHYRRTQGLPAQSINWGAWAKLGMANKLEKTENFGIGLIELEQGLQALGSILRDPQLTQVGVLPMDWAKYFLLPGAKRKWLSQIQHQPIASTQTPSVKLIDLLANAEPNDYENIIKLHLRTLLQQTLNFDKSVVIEDHTGFFELGMDSLMMVELQHQLEASLGKSLPVTDMMNNATLHALYLEIVKILNLKPAEAKQTAATINGEDDKTLQDQFKTLSPEEIANFIKEENE